MSTLITVSRKSEKFLSFLDGSFSDEQRAIPLQTLNANTQNETVTFRLIDRSAMACPSTMDCWIKALKLKNFLLVIFPIYIMSVKNWVDHRIKDPTVWMLSLLSLIFLYAGVNLRNEYSDHMLGFDRIFPDTGSRVLQKGYLAAHEVKKMSWIFIFLALVVSLPILLVFPELIITMILTVFVFNWAVLVDRSNFKYHKGGEIAVFLLMGPLLCCGFDVSVTGGASAESVAIGLVWGWISVFLVHLNNLESIMDYSRAKFLNTVSYLGFDKAKKMLAVWWIIFVILFSMYHYFYLGFFWWWFFTMTVSFLSIRFVSKTLALRSPLGSDLKRLKKRGYYLYLIVIMLWTVESLWLLIPAL